MIVRRRGRYLLYTKDGKRLLGKHYTREGAEKQEAAIEAREKEAESKEKARARESERARRWAEWRKEQQ